MDEAVLPADAYTQKQAMMGQLAAQQEEFKSRMAGLPPDKRQHFMQQQQLVMVQMQEQVGCAECAAWLACIYKSAPTGMAC